jgi:hypothetical protein
MVRNRKMSHLRGLDKDLSWMWCHETIKVLIKGSKKDIMLILLNAGLSSVVPGITLYTGAGVCMEDKIISHSLQPLVLLYPCDAQTYPRALLRCLKPS